MLHALNPLGQVSLSVPDVDAAEAFYTGALGLRKLYRYGDLLFLDAGGVRLFIEKANAEPFTPHSSVFYFRTLDLAASVRRLAEQGVELVGEPHRIAPMPDHDLWMAFFKDPAGNLLALMQEAPRGHDPSGRAANPRPEPTR